MRDNPEDAKIGERIAHLRTDVLPNLTQTQFASRLSVTRGAVGNWELGKGIKRENLQKIATEFGASFEWLATGRGQPIEDPTKLADDGKIRNLEEVREYLARVANLKPANVEVLISMLEGFQQANAAPQSQTPPRDQSEPASRRRESAPSR